MRIKVSDLTPRQLNYAVCAIEGKALRQSLEALHDEVAKRVFTGPFTMYEIVHTHVESGPESWAVAPITVTGVGRPEDPMARVIQFTSQGRRCLGSACNYFFTEEEARNEALIWSVGLHTDHGFDHDWSQAGPIIEREGIDLYCNVPASIADRHKGWLPSWRARYTRCGVGTEMVHGPTPLIAAMRCYVAAKLGDEVEIPEGV